MEEAQVSIVIVPLPAQSHLNQLLHLAAILSSHNLPVHFLGSATHNRQAKLRQGSNLIRSAQIRFHDLTTLPIATPDPTTNPDKIPVQLAPAVAAYLELLGAIGSLVQEMSTKTPKKVILIYDRLIAEAVGDAVLIPNVESSAFNCLSGFNLFYVLWEALKKPFEIEDEINNLFSVTDFYPESVLQFIVSKPEHFKNRAGDIHNTVRTIDGKYIDLLAREEIGGKKQQWAISPTLNPKFITNHDTRTRHECLNWLDRQAPGSVVYVSFGTSVSFSKDEINEIALGLEQSNRKFIWVLRDADKADIFSGDARKLELPDKFENRVCGRGLVVRDWAPQMDILAHKSTGGFMSHCGWNSCFESLMTGVPILAWPMHSDQPLNAIFMTCVLKIGLVMRKWEEREGILRDSVIADVVKRLMSSEEGDGIRKWAVEISAALRKAADEGGEYCRELESFIAHITR